MVTDLEPFRGGVCCRFDMGLTWWKILRLGSWDSVSVVMETEIMSKALMATRKQRSGVSKDT